jgi:hypothetical protein
MSPAAAAAAALIPAAHGHPQTASDAYKAKNDAVLEQLGAVKVVPVIALDSADDAVPLAHALK